MASASSPLSRLACLFGGHTWEWALSPCASSRGDFDVIEACATCHTPGRAWRSHVIG